MKANPIGMKVRPHRSLRRAVATALTAALLCGGAAMTTTVMTAMPASAASATTGHHTSAASAPTTAYLTSVTSGTTTGFLSCDDLEGGATVMLSSATDYPVFSEFYISVDGGQFNTSVLYLEQNGNYYYYANGNWSQTQVEQPVSGTVGGTHTVTAWNVESYGGSAYSYPLGTCTSSDLLSSAWGGMNYIGL